MTSIGNSAFAETSFTSVEIPSHITELGEDAFRRCIDLEDAKISSEVKILPRSFFQDCINLRKVELPASTTSIYGEAFMDCETLEEVNLDNIVYIGDGAFNNCKKLKSVYLPSIEIILKEAFLGCTGLTTVTLGCNISEFMPIGKYDRYSSVFENCENLTDFYCHAEKVPNTGWGDFRGAYIEYATLHVPASAIEAYRSTSPWSDFGSIVPIETGINEALSQDKVQSSSQSEAAEPSAKFKVQSESWYTLNGICVTQPRDGIYIRNGRKVVIK